MLPLVGALLPIIGGVLDKIIPDKAGSDKAKQEVEKALIDAANRGLLAQIEVNKVEAAHRSIFVAGWRPFIGWTCGVAFAFMFVVAPIMEWSAPMTGLQISPINIETGPLMTVLLGMLGLGGLRTYEKQKGLTR